MSEKALLQNYYRLREKVDEFCRQIQGVLAGQMACQAGCDGCCRHFSVFPVEALALAVALRELPADRVALLRKRAAQAETQSCPALSNGLCEIYEARPLICRTHGLPVATSEDGTRKVDHCPLNFRDISVLPGGSVLELDRLNEALVAVNALFLRQYRQFSEARMWLAEALLLDVVKE